MKSLPAVAELDGSSDAGREMSSAEVKAAAQRPLIDFSEDDSPEQTMGAQTAQKVEVVANGTFVARY